MAQPSGSSLEGPRDSLIQTESGAGSLPRGVSHSVPKMVLICRCNTLGMLGGEESDSGHPPHKVLAVLHSWACGSQPKAIRHLPLFPFYLFPGLLWNVTSLGELLLTTSKLCVTATATCSPNPYPLPLGQAASLADEQGHMTQAGLENTGCFQAWSLRPSLV